MSDGTVEQVLAGQALGWFVAKRRADESSYVSLRDGAPEWVSDLVREAHGVDADGSPAMLPDDWRYDAIVSALECVVESDDAEDAAHEWADGMVNTYTGERLAWLASHPVRCGYCDAAQADGMVDADEDIVGRIGAGQYVEAREVFELVLGSLSRQAGEVSA